MHSITYVSTAKTLLSKSAINELLIKSHANNLKFDITGMLLYHEGTFMQVIEGPLDPIFQLWANIKKDPLHHSITTLLDEPVAERAFPQWSMGFKHLCEESAAPGYTDFLSTPPIIKDFFHSPLETKRLLGSFADSLR